MNKNYLKIYKTMLWGIFAIFSVLFIVYLANCFYTHKQNRINESMITDLTWDVNYIKLRQLKVLVNNDTYIVKNELLVSDVKLKIRAMNDLPITLIDKLNKVEKAKYYPDFKLLIIPVTDIQVDTLKIRFGIMKCIYILMILFAVWQIKRMLTAVEKQNYFKGKNVTNCLSWISIIMVLVPVFNFAFNFFLERYLRNVSAIEDFKFQTDYNFSVWLWIAASSLCIIAAGIVKNGVRMKEEQDLTI